MFLFRNYMFSPLNFAYCGMTTQPRMTNATDSMTVQPQVANSNSGNHTMGYSYQTNLTNQVKNPSSRVPC